jgi:4-hydroxy-tetrahydrodipicolinate synthase
VPRLDETAAGVFIISVTPFLDNGNIDFRSTDGLIEFYLERGVTGVTILGIMGEAPKLTGAEAIAFSRRVVQRVAGRVPVVVGVSGPGLAAMRELAQAVMSDGAAGVMVAPPATVRTDDAILGYYRDVAEQLGSIPFVLQDFPQANGVQIAPGVIRRIVDDTSSCVMLKHEDWPGLSKISALRRASHADTERPMRRIAILVGNGGLFLPEELRRGADGAMSGFAFPEMLVGVIAAHAAGDQERRRRSSTPTCRWPATSSNRASAWRYANTSWPSVAPSLRQRNACHGPL